MVGHRFPVCKAPTIIEYGDAQLVLVIIGNGITVHGFRSCFKDWAREQTNFARSVEAALAHTIGDKTEAAYARARRPFDKRRKLMDAWAA